MGEVLGLEDLSLQPNGRKLSISFSEGSALAITGPSGSGKSRLLKVLQGLERPGHGLVRHASGTKISAVAPLNRRLRLHNVARRADTMGGSAAQATDILLATRLWDFRHLTIGELSENQVACAELIEPLISGADLIVIDGQLDRLDPWTLKSVMNHIESLRGQGAIFVVSTNRPDLIEHFGMIAILNHQDLRFVGTIQDLLRLAPPHTIHVATENRPGVKALVAPFNVTLRETPDGLVMQAAEGQALAAKLLLEGYGDVRFLVMHSPTVEEAILTLGL